MGIFMRQFIFPALAAISLTACAAPVASADQGPAPRMMTVSGSGEATGVPDVVILSIGVETEAPTAAAALSQNADRMRATINKLKERGVAERDMQTQNLSVGPRYDYDTNGRPPRLVGYSATNTLTVKLREMKEAGSIIDDVVSEGANSLGGVSFSFDDPAPLMNEARKAAVKDAKDKAALYASAAGVTLGAILQIQEGHAAPPSPLPYMEMRAVSKADATPISAGEAVVSATVTLVYEIR